MGMEIVRLWRLGKVQEFCLEQKPLINESYRD